MRERSADEGEKRGSLGIVALITIEKRDVIFIEVVTDLRWLLQVSGLRANRKNRHIPESKTRVHVLLSILHQCLSSFSSPVFVVTSLSML